MSSISERWQSLLFHMFSTFTVFASVECSSVFRQGGSELLFHCRSKIDGETGNWTENHFHFSPNQKIRG